MSEHTMSLYRALTQAVRDGDYDATVDVLGRLEDRDYDEASVAEFLCDEAGLDFLTPGLALHGVFRPGGRAPTELHLCFEGVTLAGHLPVERVYEIADMYLRDLAFAAVDVWEADAMYLGYAPEVVDAARTLLADGELTHEQRVAVRDNLSTYTLGLVPRSVARYRDFQARGWAAISTFRPGEHGGLRVSKHFLAYLAHKLEVVR